jgi:ubiquinone/menaquinone biosynthesis C-methylase UbiE
MTDSSRHPALIIGRLTPIYDRFVRLFLREKAFKHDLVARARILPGHRVLDLGAGTGTLAIMIKRVQPGARVRGLDSDPAILTIALEKARRAGADVAFDVGDAIVLPYRDASFDRVLSSLVFSVLSHDDKQRAAREAYRVLADGGELHVADFGPPHMAWGRLLAGRMRHFAPIVDNLDGRLPAIFRDAGFGGVQEVARFATALGTISILSCRRTD